MRPAKSRALKSPILLANLSTFREHQTLLTEFVETFLSRRTVRGVSWSEVATVSNRKSHRGLDLDLSLNSEEEHLEGLEEERWNGEYKTGDG